MTEQERLDIAKQRAAKRLMTEFERGEWLDEPSLIALATVHWPELVNDEFRKLGLN